MYKEVERQGAGCRCRFGPFGLDPRRGTSSTGDGTASSTARTAKARGNGTATAVDLEDGGRHGHGQTRPSTAPRALGRRTGRPSSTGRDTGDLCRHRTSSTAPYGQTRPRRTGHGRRARGTAHRTPQDVDGAQDVEHGRRRRPGRHTTGEDETGDRSTAPSAPARQNGRGTRP